MPLTCVRLRVCSDHPVPVRVMLACRRQVHGLATHSGASGASLARMRRLKRVGIQVSFVLMSTGVAGGITSGSLPGIPSSLLIHMTKVTGAVSLLYLSALLLQNQGQVHLVWHSNALHLEQGVPPYWISSSSLQHMPSDAVTVRCYESNCLASFECSLMLCIAVSCPGLNCGGRSSRKPS